MEHVQGYMEHENITKEIILEEAKIFQKYSQTLRLEEEAWRLKSYCLWLKSGDINASYFHKQ